MILTLIYFILILGAIVLVHEFGHFFFAKLFGIHVYEFSIGMGPKLFGWKRKNDVTDYSIRAIPIGGFCALAGEDNEYDDQEKVPKDRRLNAKPVWQRFLVMVFGAGNNFLLAILLLFIIALGWGATTNEAIVSEFSNYITVTESKVADLKKNDKILMIDNIEVNANENSDLEYYLNKVDSKKVTVIVERKGKEAKVTVDSSKLLEKVTTDVPVTPAEKAGLQIGDKIVKINGHKIKSSDDVSIYLQIEAKNKPITFTVERDGETLDIEVTPAKETVDGNVIYRVGIMSKGKTEHGFIPAIKYTFTKLVALIRQMIITFKGLFTGGLSVKQLSGPVGIYNIVGTSAKSGGLVNLLYLTALLSVNVGFLNLLPFPAFDGGRVLFLIIEKIKGTPVKPETENKIHTIGFFLLIALMIYITFNDVIKLIFK